MQMQLPPKFGYQAVQPYSASYHYLIGQQGLVRAMVVLGFNVMPPRHRSAVLLMQQALCLGTERAHQG